MELQQLKYFQAVARFENMTRAAEELHITQPSLSITISRLEESVGVPLFDRYGRNIKLNEFGKVFLRRVERALYELEEAKREVNDIAGLEFGTVSLGCTNLVILPDLLDSYLSQHPHIKFRLMQDTRSKMQQQLENAEIDFCITSPPIRGPKISCYPLFNEEIMLIVPKKHRLAEYESVDIHELIDEPFVNLKAGYGIRDITDDICRQLGFTPNIIFEVNEPSLIASIVQSGLGVAFHPLSAWKGYPSRKIKRIRLNDPSFRRTIGLSWLKDRYLSSASRSFREFVIQYYSTSQGKLNKNKKRE